MKILFVHERFGAFAGAEVNALLTAAELKKRGHAVAILHGEPTGKGEAIWRETVVPCFPVTDGQSVKSAIEQFQPDAIYVHKMADLGVIEALLAAHRPLVRMVHDHDLYCMRSYKYNPFTRRICARAATPWCIFPCGAVLARNRDGGLPVKWVSYSAKLREIALNRQFHRLVVATEYMREELVRNKFNPQKIEIHAPVPKALEVAETASFSDRNLIVYSGQIIRGKGVDVLLESLTRVQVPFECVILGDGGHRAYCEELSRKLGLSGKVTFKGFVPHDELRSYFLDASLSVVSSVWPEPFGAAGLEAMRFGLPVVAFDAGGIREWCIDGQNGFLAPWMDRVTYAKRVEQLLRDKSLARQLGENGRRFVREKFDFARYIGGLEKVFEQLAAEHKSGTAT